MNTRVDLDADQVRPVLTEVCRVCSQSAKRVFNNTVLGKEISYFECAGCGYLQTESPDWLERAYAKAINQSDTGILIRNQANVGRVIMTLVSCGKLRGTVVDHAGGYGILVRMLRDAGLEAWWTDKYCENLVACGFEAQQSECDLLTAFEVFEHLVDPVAELRTMLERAPLVLISTELITIESTPSPDWWYLGTDHGQHIGFFRVQTLRAMSRQLDCHFRTDGFSIHLFSRDPIPATWLPLLKCSRWWRTFARFSLHPKTDSDSRAQAAAIRVAGTQPKAADL